MMTKKIKKIIVTVVFLVAMGSIGAYKFDSDSQKFFKIKNSVLVNGGAHFMDNYGQTNSFSNILVKGYFSYYKNKFKSRFVDQSEVFKPIPNSDVLNKIAALYRNYWVKDFMKTKDDTKDYNLDFVKQLGKYLIDNNLSDLKIDNIKSFKDIRADLKNAIKKEGAYCETFFLNDKFDIIIWKSQVQKTFKVETPSESRNIPVIFFSDKVLDNRQSFITFDTQKTGGWPKNKEGVIYCGGYDEDSELFKYSFLTHEANHFFDLEKYPNLSPADLEYRSKLVELIYIKKDKNRILRGFLTGASNKNRSHGHAYANFKVIHELSKQIFNKPFEGNYALWKKVPVEQINKIAAGLLEANEKKLNSNPTLIELI